ncbi:PREDICTED: C2 domain-containing protein 2-like [Priapulus caudatus]|uniref:C2 domain-containing protein 2-like n=1 Tax=Priapulus caudatus TaxID=37621 RepID=A0ABM1DN95_PRICU|nr:PREDICTED: C2 domain-containing protein 2-like [Priapulus caudatus]
MADVTLKLLWYKVREGYDNMAAAVSGARASGSGDGFLSFASIDMLDILLVIWIAIVGIIVAFGHLLPNIIRKRDEEVGLSIPVPAAWAIPAPTAGEQRKSTTWLEAGSLRETCEWANAAAHWFYQNYQQTPELVHAWLKSLNDHAREDLLGRVEIVFSGVETKSSAPRFCNVSTVTEPGKNEMTVQTGVNVENISFTVQAKEKQDGVTRVSDYIVTLERLAGELHVRFSSMQQDMHMTVSFAHQPDVVISSKLESLQNPDEQVKQSKVEEQVLKALTMTVTTVNLTGFKQFPKMEQSVFEPINHVIQQVAEVESSSPSVPSAVPAVGASAVVLPGGQLQLLVKVIKAKSLGEVAGCIDPYCVVELDNPARKCMTSVIRDTVNPFWDEHFVFPINTQSEALTFDLYDRAKDTGLDFLGQAVVSVSELRSNPTPRQIIDLAGRPEKDDEEVSGAITLEFAYMDGEILPQNEAKQTTSATPKPIDETPIQVSQQSAPAMQVCEVSVEKDVSAGSSVASDPVSTSHSDVCRVIDFGSEGLDDAEDVNSPAEAAIRDLEGGHQPRTPTKTSHLMITGVIRGPSTDVEENHEAASASASPTPATASGDESSRAASADRGRSKERTGLMGTLRKKLSLKKRSQSYSGYEEEKLPQEREGSLNRQSTGQHLSLPTSRRGSNKSGSLLEVPGMKSTENFDGHSLTSAMTYITENSTIVIETTEKDKSHKYYLIPNCIAKEGLHKLHIKGTKLHIYSDHTFIASHFPSTTACQICSKSIPRRIGRQGYMCRDCKIVCHKHCHHKCDTECPTSQVSKMK